jgi:phenylacetate-coenzyme A ligase PaaK-like adenylate-forming protein
MQVSPLDSWISAELGQKPGQAIDLPLLRAHQLRKINQTMAHAIGHSPFYRRQLQRWCDRPLSSLADLEKIPFTTSADLCNEGLQMLAVSQGEIDRVVTLQSSGTTGNAKRLYFTGKELALTQAFFRCGMSQVLKPGHLALVLLPGELPASAGDLLARALEPMGVTCRVFGLVTDPGACAALLAAEPFDCVVGIPVQVLSLLRHPKASAIPRHRIKSVFLTSDFVPKALVEEIGRRWGCPAFNHYGMTELALSAGVECLALAGYHLREPDLYFEIVDPDSGRVLPQGETGEVVVTTLSRTGMPLIRYRTDDLARFLPEPCPCGSALPRLSKLQGRLAKRVDLGGGHCLGLPELDEALFVIAGLVNFRAVLSEETGINQLALTVETVPGREQATLMEVDHRLPKIAPVQGALRAGTLRLSPTALCDTPLPVSATIKRNIERQRS